MPPHPLPDALAVLPGSWMIRTTPNGGRWRDNSLSMELPKKAGGAARRAGEGATWGRGSKGEERLGQRARKSFWNQGPGKSLSNLPHPVVHIFVACLPTTLAWPQMAVCRRHQSGSSSLLYYLGCGLFPFPNGCMSSCPWKNPEV